MNYFDRWFSNLRNSRIHVEYHATATDSNPLLLQCTLKAVVNNKPIEFSRLSVMDNHLNTKDLLMGELLKHVPQALPFTQ